MGETFTTGDDALRHHEAFDLEAAMGAAHKAATKAFKDAGMPNPKAVVNVAWSAGGSSYVAGSRVPNRTPKFLAESLRATAEEIEDA